MNIDELVEEISKKFGYDEELKITLKRIIPVMIKGKNEEICDLLYETLQTVKIFVLEESATAEDIKNIRQEVYGKLNQHVKFVSEERGEYDKLNAGQTAASGAYETEPIFDENMNLIGGKGYIYISKLSKYNQITEVYGTTINISHLIHEIGHAWASRKDEYVLQNENEYTMNIGMYSTKGRIDKDNKQVIEVKSEGLLIEEALNSVEEERVLCEILKIEDITKLLPQGYVNSNYQGYISNIMKAYVEKFGQEQFDELRFLKNSTEIEKIEEMLKKTDVWSKMQTSEYIAEKKDTFSKIENLEVSDEAKRRINEIISEYESTFFENDSSISPMQKLEKVFEQLYDLSMVKYNFGIINNENNRNIYNEICIFILREAYVMKNQAQEPILLDAVAETGEIREGEIKASGDKIIDNARDTERDTAEGVIGRAKI